MTDACRRRVVALFLVGLLGSGAVAAFGFWTVPALYDSGSHALAHADSLSAPSAPTATANGQNSITVGWTLPASQLAGAQYKVTRTAGPGSPVVVCTVASNVTSCQDTGLSAGTSYNYSVGAALQSWLSSTVTASATTLAVTTTTLPSGDVDSPYSTTLAAIGGTGSYTWTRTAGTLPSWATLNSSTGTISGTPSATGTTSGLVFRATDGNGATASSVSLSITINSAQLLVSSITSTNSGATGSVAGKAEVNDTFSVTFNNALDPTTVATGTTQSMTICAKNNCDPNLSGGNSKIVISGLTASTGFTMATNYVTDNKTATLAGTLTLSGDQKTVTFKVISVTSGSSDLQTGAAASFTFTPLATIKDTGARAAGTAFSQSSIQLF